MPRIRNSLSKTALSELIYYILVTTSVHTPPSNPLSESVPLNLPDPLHARQPAHAAPGKLLHFGFELGLVQIEIVNGADAQDALPGRTRADAVHEGAARGAEEIGHVVAGAYGTLLAPCLEGVAAAQVLEVRVGDGEVGCEHGGGDFVAVGAVADEGVDQAGALGRLGVFAGGIREQEIRCVWGEAEEGREHAGKSRVHRRADLGARLTNASCTAPQKHVAVASSFLE